LLGTNTKPNQVLAASVINALVMEFSGTGKSSMIGLSLAGHAEAKLYFETNELPGIFSLGLVLIQNDQLSKFGWNIFEPCKSWISSNIWILSHKCWMIQQINWWSQNFFKSDIWFCHGSFQKVELLDWRFSELIQLSIFHFGHHDLGHNWSHQMILLHFGFLLMVLFDEFQNLPT